MARNQSGLSVSDSPLVADDFGIIRGIGPALARRLHKAGVCTYSQLASLSPDELAAKVSGLSTKRIAGQRWINQARHLAAKRLNSQSRPKESSKQAIHQHYENFTVELLLDEKRRLRRTRLTHIQSGDTKTWTGWETDQLTNFIAKHTGAHIPSKKPDDPITRKKQHKSTIKNSDANQGTWLPSSPSNVFETTQVSDKTSPPVQLPTARINLTGLLGLQDLKVLPIDSDIPVHSLRQDQPCRVRLSVDLTNVTAPAHIPIRYDITIHFKQLGGTTCLAARGSNGIEMSEHVTLDVICAGLPPGLYRPEALVKLFSGKTTLGLMASRKGELIQVY